MGLYTTTEQAAAPSTPASGSSVLYPKTDGLWYWKDDSGVEHAIVGDGSEITGATLNNCVGKGTWTTSGTWTLPALTLGGNVASTGNPSINIGSGVLTGGSATLNRNTAAPAAIGSEVLRLVQADSTTNRLLMDSFAAVNGLTVRRSNGTAASPSALTNGDFLFAFSSQGYGSTGYTGTIAAAMWIQATGTWTDTSTPTRIFFDVCANGTSTRATALTLEPTAITTASPLVTPGYTVGTLPAGTVGMRAYVTDATVPTYNGALTGGGAVTVPVFYNGAAWVSA